MSILIPIIIGIAVVLFRQAAKSAKKFEWPAAHSGQREENVKPVAIKNADDQYKDELSSSYARLKENMVTRRKEHAEPLKVVPGRTKSFRMAVKKPNRETIIEGMMLSEVLGKPRAKNPHSSMNRYKIK